MTINNCAPHPKESEITIKALKNQSRYAGAANCYKTKQNKRIPASIIKEECTQVKTRTMED
jgi:hypothetical protein